ncbi:phosphoenolpyruvate carboxylase [Helicobacter monodelphidis]|uniref:phosphoenolpyruvate carboxylase n=1 Tax=Helicobacter sp. 15-1451 TaxID=2004995 RepID=UPI000DCDEDFC|nr:phosphoenolpyruvate carboxylase [Helicobacter sp. 15-1451]RAX56706.1 phosphoenolpyruvate carboxylase [Helicobacter sp. 15-1451]
MNQKTEKFHQGVELISSLMQELLSPIPHVYANFIALQQSFAKGKDIEQIYAEELPHLKEQTPELVRAFSLYNMLLNVVEELYGRERESEHILLSTMKELEQDGFDRRDILKVLGQIQFYPVFTAHPTESRRRTFLESHHDFSQYIAEILNNKESIEAKRAYERLLYRLAILWRTHLVRDEKIQVLFELDNLLYIIESSLLLSALKVCKQASTLLDAPLEQSPIKLGSWIGGDRDGNPNVNNHIMLEVMKIQHQAIIKQYIERIDRLSRELSHAGDLCSPKKELLESIQKEIHHLPPAIHTLHQNEPFRAKLRLMRQKVENRLIYVNHSSGVDFIYHHSRELIADIDLLIDSLDSTSTTFLKEFRNLVLLGGFHLFEMDFREHRDVLGAALEEIFSLLGFVHGGFFHLPKEKKIQILHKALEAEPINLNSLSGRISKTSEEITESFLRIAWAKDRISENIMESFIVSMTQDATDMLGVLWFAKQSGLWVEKQKSRISITPLLETIDDLQRAEEIMRDLHQSHFYKQYLIDHRHRQEIMIGYSDSSKDGGIFSSNYSLNQTITQLISLEQELGVKFKLFHGRGGSTSRGGGRLQDALFASPKGSVSGLLKTTEQGEVIASKYLNRQNAEFHFATTLATLLKCSVNDCYIANTKSIQKLQQDLMQQVHEVSRREYRQLVYESDGFIEYFKKATPIYFIQQLNIGSRPSKRKDTLCVEDLRAIPWVFAWTQNRAIIPAWYGVGSGIEGAFFGQEDCLQECYQEVPYFRVIINNVAHALLKVDLQITALYHIFVENKVIQECIFTKIQQEYNRTLHWVKMARNEQELLNNDKALRESILLRAPSLNATNLFQVELIRQFYASSYDDQKKRLIKEINSTIVGIAQGMRNTG